MLLHLSDISPESLHSQISRQIRSKILIGELKEGEMLPSIRSMARDIKVSVITVQRAYDDLTKEGLLLAKHGIGYFVQKLTDDQKRKISQSRLNDSIIPIIRDALSAGLTHDQIKGAIKQILESEEKK